MTALILFHYFTSIVTTVCKQQHCWKLKTFNMSSLNIYTFCTHCLCCHIYFSCSRHKQLNDDLKDIIHCGACSSWANVDDKIFLERVVSATIQSNLSLADMLHNGDLVIEDTFLSNRLNHGQTLYIAGIFVKRTLFWAPEKHFGQNLPVNSGHPVIGWENR